MTPPELDGWTGKQRDYKLPTISWQFVELRTAKEWGLYPSQFDALDPEDKARMIAYDNVSSILESYHIEMASEKNRSMAPDELRPGEFGSREAAFEARRGRRMS